MGESALSTRFTKLVGCDYPIQQAGMGPVATPELVAAVSEAGALGMLGGEGLSAEALDAALDKIRKLTNRSFGVNFLVPFLDELKTVTLAAERSRVVEFFYGEPDVELVRLAHSCGALVSWQVGSANEAKAAADVGVDFLIAQGIEAGGHLRGRIGWVALLNQILKCVAVPVLAAGGIGDGRGLAAALAAGAAGVRMGTRFVAAEESGAHPVYVQKLIEARAEDTVITDVFSANWKDSPHRVLRSCVDAVHNSADSVIGETDGKPVARFSGNEPIRQTTGNIAAMCLYAGESVGCVRRVQTASQILREVLDEAVRFV